MVNESSLFTAQQSAAVYGCEHVIGRLQQPLEDAFIAYMG